MNNATLIAQQINKNFMQGKTPISVLHNIDVTFVQGHTYAITGLSGAGKSTFIHIIAGLDTPTTGSVLFNNTAIQKLPADERAHFLNKSIGLVFQSPHLMGELSVIENVMLPGLIAGHKKSDCAHKALELLHKVGLAQKADSKPGELSGGQQQRVAIARALINDPLFLLADEPTGNLDHTTGIAIIDLLVVCQRTWGMGIIVSSHDAYVAQAMEHVYELADGTLTKK
jgi:lipoprotein-releasing system ATP-binding protein